ncbi:MAG: elongation factor 1-beta [Candidatus Woesearchaeota archaeon]
MANVVITIKILPSDPEVDIDELYEKALPILKENGAIIEPDLVRKEVQPIGFGLSALIIRFLYPESKGNPDVLEDALRTLDNVDEVSIVDVRRAFG